MNRRQDALLLSISWLEYIWNRETTGPHVAVLGVNLEDMTIEVYCDEPASTHTFNTCLDMMMQHVDNQIQDGYGDKN